MSLSSSSRWSSEDSAIIPPKKRSDDAACFHDDITGYLYERGSKRPAGHVYRFTGHDRVFKNGRGQFGGKIRRVRARRLNPTHNYASVMRGSRIIMRHSRISM
jgi:hypothetical protein